MMNYKWIINGAITGAGATGISVLAELFEGNYILYLEYLIAGTVIGGLIGYGLSKMNKRR